MNQKFVAINFGYSKLMDKNKEELVPTIPLLKNLVRAQGSES